MQRLRLPALGILLLAATTVSAEQVQLKVATLAPEGSSWFRVLQDMGEEWRKGWHPEVIAPRASDTRVLVVGAGPAGLEAARALGQRGYEVMLAEASADPEDVLWDQPLSSANQNAYVNQDFSDLPTYSSFLADDFVNGETWDLSSIFVPGSGWNGSCLAGWPVAWSVARVRPWNEP